MLIDRLIDDLPIEDQILQMIKTFGPLDIHSIQWMFYEKSKSSNLEFYRHFTGPISREVNKIFEDLKRDSIIKYDQYQNTFFIDSQVVRFKIKEYKKQMYHKHSLKL